MHLLFTWPGSGIHAFKEASYIHKMNYAQRYIISFTILINFTNCRMSFTNNATRQFQNDSLIVDPRIKEFINFVVREPEDGFDETLFEKYLHAADLKKSSTVEITKINDKFNFVKTYNRLVCRAFIKNDTLIIRNGVTGTDAGYGEQTEIINNKILTKYYTYVALHPREIFRFKSEKQNITLDRVKYSRGDSLFGSIYTRLVDQNKYKYYITGLFRTKVE